MANKILPYKSSISISYSNKRKFIAHLKEYIVEFIENLLILILSLLILCLTGITGYKSYKFYKIKTLKSALSEENKILKQKYRYLTSREILWKKAKKLGLRPPTYSDYLKLIK